MARRGWRGYDDWDDWGWGGYREAIAVKGGIKAQSQRGAFGESWWAKRWIAVLEGFNLGARLTRGRSYARRGQVVSIEIGKGAVKARVQGSYPQPYRVSINLKALDEKQWARLAESLSSQALFAAKLLAGEMPQEIESAFRDAGLSLFPERARDLQTDCSCPDWSNPCKHIAAVYYLLGEEFDRDPFLLFKLRGMEREEFIKRLERLGASRRAKGQTEDGEAETAKHHQPEPLAEDAKGFWAGGEIANDLFGEVDAPAAESALLKRLGKFPFWRGSAPLSERLDPVYMHAAILALDIFAGVTSQE